SAAAITVTATAVWHFTDGTHTADVTRADNSGATARVVDANTSVSEEGASEVGHSPTVTITTNAVQEGTTATVPSIMPHYYTSPLSSFSTYTCGTPTQLGNTPSCSSTLFQSSAAAITVTATAVWHFTDGAHSTNVTRATDGTNGSNSGATAQF